MHIPWLADVSAFVGILSSLGVFVYVRRIARTVSVLKDYPPHQHVHGSILYPPDFAPGKVRASGG
jgi:hypothetical protein